MGFKFYLNETIIKKKRIRVRKWFLFNFIIFPKFFNFKFVFRKINFRDYNPNSEVYDLHYWNNGILFEIKLVEVVKVLFGVFKKFCLNYFSWI
jgi:hypothetical protein